jgi:thiol-disulfide isomerase/thioredoxin
MQRKTLSILCAWLAATGVLAAPARAQSPQPSPQSFPQAPALEVKTLAGDEFDLARLHGQVVLVHFWATWCAPCIKEMPALGNFYEKYRGRGVVVIALSEDRARDLDEVQHMMHHMNMTYPVAMAHKANVNSFGDPATLPVTYVLDAQGAVRAEMRPDTQPVTEENLAQIVEPLLAKP